MPFSLGKSFIERLRNRIRNLWGGDDEGDSHINPMLQGPATGIDVIMYRIRFAARNRLLLWMKYQGAKSSAPTWRHVEPYSFRARANPGPQPLFYGWCRFHDEIHSFRIDRILDIHVTDRPFSPRVEVEIG